MSHFVKTQDKPAFGVGCRSPPTNLDFQKIQIGGKGRGVQSRTGRKEMAALERSEEKILRECGVSENIIEEIRNYDRTEFNSNRRFYRRLNDIGEYIEDTAEQEHTKEVKTVIELLDEIENEELYQALITVNKHTLQIVLLKIQAILLKRLPQ